MLKLDVRTFRARRQVLGLSMEQAAKAAGFKYKQQWSIIESGQSADVRVSTLGRIAKALKCKPTELLK